MRKGLQQIEFIKQPDAGDLRIGSSIVVDAGLLPAILERARESFGMTSVALLESYSPDEDARAGPARPSTTAGQVAEPAKARTYRRL